MWQSAVSDLSAVGLGDVLVVLDVVIVVVVQAALALGYTSC